MVGGLSVPAKVCRSVRLLCPMIGWVPRFLSVVGQNIIVKATKMFSFVSVKKETQIQTQNL